MNKLRKMRDLLLNPRYQFRNGFGLIELVKHHIDEMMDTFSGNGKEWKEFDDLCNEVIELLLLRLMNISPHVYAITVGQFEGFDGIEEYWEKEGFKDTDGYHWMKPKPFGPYAEWKFSGSK